MGFSDGLGLHINLPFITYRVTQWAPLITFLAALMALIYIMGLPRVTDGASVIA